MRLSSILGKLNVKLGHQVNFMRPHKEKNMGFDIQMSSFHCGRVANDTNPLTYLWIVPLFIIEYYHPSKVLPDVE